MIIYDDTFKVWIEILKLLVSFMTPILILILGIIINKNVGKNKISLLKEKEWQSRWAESFLDRALKLEENISSIIVFLFNLQNKEDQTKVTKMIEEIKKCLTTIQYLEWDIQNYVQFAYNNKDDVMKKQTELITRIRGLIDNRNGSLEEVRSLQFEFNKTIRNAHNEILNNKT